MTDTFQIRLQKKTLELMDTPAVNPLPQEIVRDFDMRPKKCFKM